MPQKKVLVVDDDHLICWALEKEFAGSGLSTHVVNNGSDALSELRRQPYDVVFLDIHLPDTNGIELLQEIDKVTPDAIIIIMSGDASDTNRQRAYNGGAVQFLEKPFDLSEVHGILKSTLGEYAHRRKHTRHICRIPFRISIVEPAQEEAQYDLHNLSGMMAEIGSGGFRLRTEYPLRVGQHVHARVEAENDHIRKFVPPESTAEVVWVAPTREGIVAGLKFLSS